MRARTNALVFVALVCALLLAGCSAEDGKAASSAAKTDPAPKVKITHKTLRIKDPIPFSRDTAETSTLDKGVTAVDQKGEPGVRIRVVEVVLKNGVEVGRKLVRNYVKQKPIAQVKLVGTRVDPKPKSAPSNCDPNYSGACVPIASDVDCAGGSGDGPAYVEGPVTVVGDDIYDLNRDDDNIACDS